MSAHIYSFGGTKELMERREQRQRERQIRAYCRRLDQDLLEQCLADVDDEVMRGRILDQFSQFLTFEPLPDTLERAHALKLERMKAIIGNDEVTVTPGLIERVGAAIGLVEKDRPTCAHCGEKFEAGWLQLPIAIYAEGQPSDFCDACVKAAGLCTCNHTPVSATFLMQQHDAVTNLICATCGGHTRKDQEDAVAEALRVHYRRLQ